MKRLNAFIGKVNAVVNPTDVAVKAACNALCRQQPLQVVSPFSIHRSLLL